MASGKKKTTENEVAELVPMVTDVSDVERVGTKLVIPEGLALRDLLVMVKRLIQDEEQEYQVIDDYDLILPEGMIAFDKAVKDIFGWSLGVATHNMFGSSPPTKVSIEVGPNKTVQASYGPIATPGIEGKITVSMVIKNGLPRLQLQVNVLNKQRGRIEMLGRRIKEIAKTDSIYKGQAIHMPTFDDDPSDHPITDFFPKFLDLSNVNADELVFTADTQAIIEDNVFGPVMHTEEYRRQGMPLKTGVLMEGPYGCGKTLTALVLAKLAVQNGWTFFLVKDARHLQTTLDFAANYQPCVVFCEDIDRVMDEGIHGRTQTIDSILNTVDGVMAKSTEMMVVLTTNHVEKISQPMLRHGRLDIVVSVGPPDAAAVEKLLRLYSRGLIPVNENLDRVCQMLAGKVPATIREVIERSKRSAVATGQKMSNGEIVIRSVDLERATVGLMRHMQLLEPVVVDARSPIEKAAATLADSVSSGPSMKAANEMADELIDNLNYINSEIDEIKGTFKKITSFDLSPAFDEKFKLTEGEGV